MHRGAMAQLPRKFLLITLPRDWDLLQMHIGRLILLLQSNFLSLQHQIHLHGVQLRSQQLVPLVMQGTDSTVWQMTRAAGFTSQLFSNDGMGAKVEIAHRSNPNATEGKITGIANYELFATKTNYVRVYESVSIQASYRPSIG